MNACRKDMLGHRIWTLPATALLCCAAGIGAGDGGATPALTGPEWPQYRGNSGFTGVAADDSVKPPLKLLWSYRTDGDTSGDAMAGVMVGGGKVFVPIHNTCSLLALDADTGRMEWEFSHPNFGTDAPTYHDGRVYLWLRRWGRSEVLALDAANGKLLWQQSFTAKARGAGGRKRAGLAVQDGKIYFVEGGDEPAVVALDEKTGNPVWRTPVGAEDGLNILPPSVAGGIVLTATRDGFNPSRKLLGATIAMDAASGKILWRRKDIYPFSSLATDGEVAACSANYSPAPSDKFHLFDARTGDTLWTRPEKNVIPPATILKDMLLIHHASAAFMALDRKTGKELWTFSGAGKMGSSGCCAPMVSGSHAYIGTGGATGNDVESYFAWTLAGASGPSPLEKGIGGTVFAVDLKTGKSVWSFGTGNCVCGEVALAYGRLYFDSRDGRVYCFAPAKVGEPTVPEAKDASPHAPAEEVKNLLAAPLDAPRPGKDWPMCGGTPDRAGLAGITLTPPLAQAWKFDGGGRVCTAAAVRDGRVFFGSDSGKIFAVDAADGRKAWEFQTGARVRSSPAVAGGMVYCGSDDGKFYALDAASGHKQWEFECGGPVQASPAVSGGIVVFGANDHNTYALDRKTGKKLWNFTGSYYNHQAPPVIHGGKVFAAQWTSWVRALDLTTGMELWRSYVPVSIEALAYARDKLYVRSPNYVMELEPGSGKRLRIGEASYGYGGMGFLKNLLVLSGIKSEYGTAGTTVIDLDAAGAKLAPRLEKENVFRLSPKEIKTGLGSMGAPQALGDKLCIVTVDGTVAMLATDGKALWSAKLGGACHASPVAADGLLVVGCDDGFVYAFREK